MLRAMPDALLFTILITACRAEATHVIAFLECQQGAYRQHARSWPLTSSTGRATVTIHLPSEHGVTSPIATRCRPSPAGSRRDCLEWDRASGVPDHLCWCRQGKQQNAGDKILATRWRTLRSNASLASGRPDRSIPPPATGPMRFRVADLVVTWAAAAWPH